MSLLLFVAIVLVLAAAVWHVRNWFYVEFRLIRAARLRAEEHAACCCEKERRRRDEAIANGLRRRASHAMAALNGHHP